MRANTLKERFEDPFMLTPVFFHKPPMLLPFLLRQIPVPKQGTEDFVTDALFLPCHLLVLPVTIRCDPAARTTERNRPVSDPLVASVTRDLAFG